MSLHFLLIKPPFPSPNKTTNQKSSILLSFRIRYHHFMQPYYPFKQIMLLYNKEMLVYILHNFVTKKTCIYLIFFWGININSWKWFLLYCL